VCLDRSDLERGLVAENAYQAKLIRKLKKMFPGIVILKNDSSYIQGMLDLTLLYQDRWATLEVKAHEGAAEQPNQRHYQRLMDDMSFSAFIYPENEEEVLTALQEAFSSRRTARVS
jgi:hypothetical protein